MKMGSDARIMMKRPLSPRVTLDKTMYSCTVLRYDSKAECIYMNLRGDELTKITLDAIYECCVNQAGEGIGCSGRIKERYHNKYGKIIKFEIENGFYKINIKSVDK